MGINSTGISKIVIIPYGNQVSIDLVMNRQELAPQTAQAAAMTGSYHEEPADAPEEDSLLDDLGEE